MSHQAQEITAMVKGFGALGLHTIQQIASSSMLPEDGNLFVSGVSLGLALLMTLWGAQGETASEMAQALGLAGLSDTPAKAKLLMEQLARGQTGVTMQLANALWARSGVSLAEPFVATCRSALGATLEVLDFGSPAASQRINGWVDEATDGLVTKLVPDTIHPLTMIFLTNAFYFKGAWSEPFDAAQTSPTRFSCWDGQLCQVAMMRNSGAMDYLEDEQVQAVQLDYVGGELAMEIYVPQERGGLARLLAAIEPDALDSWSRRFRRRQGSLGLPRFKVQNNLVLNRVLMALGIKLAFDSGQADFGGMTNTLANSGLFISNVMHNSVMQVDEQGAEAAAATAVEMRLRSMAPPERPFNLVADHPFLVVLRDKVSGAALMQGIVGRPVDPGA